MKVVEDLPYISGHLIIHTCGSLQRVSNLPQVKCLYASSCPSLRTVEKFYNLQQLGLSEDMQD
uniref:Uncharacterized protein n=1 Tax=Arundo donax TaxID=35708 RepID=A0A0A9B2A9_ARUDO